jgi:hypothetical protein
MFITTLLAVSAIAAATWAFGALSLSNPVKILLVGVILIAIARWTRRLMRNKGKV